jgi:hypothetical protein
VEAKIGMPELRADLIDILIDGICEKGEDLYDLYSELLTLSGEFDELSIREIIKTLVAVFSKGILPEALFRVLASLVNSALRFQCQAPHFHHNCVGYAHSRLPVLSIRSDY